jgi:acetyl-CoA C-acetyltransferase
VPVFVTDYAGPALLETFTIVYDRAGQPTHGVVIGRTPQSTRFMARVASTDAATLARLTDLDHTPVGSVGLVRADGQGLLNWTAH